jgi:hypothetical protein
MNDALRLLLLVAIAGTAVTAAGSAAAWWMDEERRLYRYLRQALGGEPQAVLIAQGRGRAVGMNLHAGRIAVLWDGGRKGLVYRLDQLMGGELMVDNAILARAHRGEPRRPLDRIPAGAHSVTLRLVFDTALEPDFELQLWPVDQRRRERASPSDVIQAARRWLAGAEAILRVPAAPVQSPKPETRLAPPPIADDPPWDEEDEEEEEDL